MLVALTFAGFKKSAARAIHRWYLTLKVDPDLGDQICLFEMVKTTVVYSNYTIDCDERDDRLTWESTLYDLGIRRQLSELIVDLAFADIRRSGQSGW